MFLTDQDGDDIPELDRCHREHAQVEDRIREGKDTGMRNLPFPTWPATRCGLSW